MRILIISPGYIPVTSKKGAIEKLLEHYLDYNEHQTDEIAVYTVKTSDGKSEIKNYQHTTFITIDKSKPMYKIQDFLYRVLNRITSIYIPGAYIRKVIKDINKNLPLDTFDCIIFENSQYNIPYFKEKTHAKNKIILHLHNDYINKNTKNVHKIIDSCDEIWPVSEFIKTRIEEVNHKNIPINVIYNGVDFENFQKELSKEEEISFKKSLDITSELVFLYTGRLMPEKGVKELIEAFNIVNKKYENTKLIIVGGTKSMRKSDSYRDYLLNISKDNKNIIFTGYVDYQDMYKYYRISDVQVVPSICNEAFGLVLLEGLPSNLTVIATKSGGIPEVLKEDAIYVDRENLKEELVIKMEEVINNLPKPKDYRDIIEKFSIENYCQNLHKMIK